ncbi:replication initiation protein [Tenacibaculum finnmarkense genomovar finnmarkense]|uniref:replication initiation protein n=2 Tax=Tenacibaculum finnmarkense TaxID=2781243 RepID=UPI00187B8245|nr:replication initiation protein [Tenacibaculum finnmarkense]MBE7635037.1 RepB family plasmid replication initiator protein [Tenacibaculum finnmarkense genomovar ulcerans]MBE7649206.1 RepB family plasmid replication initiator protein [Tenacibaculum finnmarkense genomovar ulcerans]MBE7661412.1 RepB family plasmid replication initiator protein [Tenacibaculum finnmarkense genomovar finnmarkense]MBE7693637.1 RepB family plasmid replication initiator protein [Tenacibaculum finnmarkense genomovar fi
MKNDEIIFQSNQVVLSRIVLSSIYEKRLLNAFVSSLSPNLKDIIGDSKGKHISEQKEFDFGKYETITYTYNLSDIEPNPQNYNRLRLAIKKLRKTDVDIILEDGTELFTGLIQVAELNTKRAETFKVKLSLDAYKYLLDLSKGYSVKSFLTSLDLKNLYSSYIYDLLCKWRNKPVFQIDLEHLRFVTNCPKSYRANDIKLRILQPAQKELKKSEVSDLTFTYEDVKKGRSIVGFKIFIHHTNKDKIETNKLIKQTSPRHDFNKEVIDFMNRNDINFNGINRKLFLEFFELNGVNNGLDELEKMKDSAMRNSRNSPQAYIIGAVKKNIIDALEKKEQTKHNSYQDSQTNIITQLAELTKRKTV